jgi:hypothetical protein
VDWDGRSDLTANDLSAPAPQADEEDTSALDQAREFLQELLRDGPVLSEDVGKAMKKAGISWPTLRRAKPLAGVKSRKRRTEDLASKDWPWEWYLPDDDGEDRWES